jgi:hypothetical protein
MSTEKKVQKITLRGTEYVFIGTQEDIEGPICVRIEDYQNGQCSYAHMTETGAIKRFHETIGYRDELEWGEILEIEVPLGDFLGGLFGESWPI